MKTGLFLDKRIQVREVRLTAYYPTPSAEGSAENRMEGGPVDRRGNRLHSLEAVLDGRAPWVSLAIDARLGVPYGKEVVLVVNDYGRLVFVPGRLVDCGGALVDQGWSRIDVCVENRGASFRARVNGGGLLVTER